MGKLPYIITTALILCLGACVPKHNDYSHFVHIDQNGWAYGDTVDICPTALDSTNVRNLSVAIRHNNSYEFRNLWLEITYGPEGNRRRDTINMDLADIYGRWHGKGIGPSYQYETMVATGVNIADSSHVYIRHIMRVDTLKGIEMIGITVASPEI